jgi:5-methylcytosine-specific restriction enzyme subunit McrC
VKNEPIIIKEFDFLYVRKGDDTVGRPNARFVEQKAFNNIERFALQNSDAAEYLRPSYKAGYGKVLQARNYVGVLQKKDGATVEILPKIADLENVDKAKEILIRMLKTLHDSPFKHFDLAYLKSRKMPLLEIFISMFLDELSALIKKGVKSGYIDKEENLRFLKGKLKTSRHILHNHTHKERFFVEYQEFLSDRVENRLIKTALELLYKKSSSNENQQRIREYLFVFDDVGACKDAKADFAKVRIDRQMVHYEQVLSWCKIFLLQDSFTPYSGDSVAFALLFDMNKLFESYIGSYFKKNAIDKTIIRLQDKTRHLAYEKNGEGKFRLKPDIVMKNAIADTKWKILTSNDDINQADMYQLYAYGAKYKDCEQLYLIYPKSDEINKEFKTEYYFDEEKPEKLKLKALFFDVEKDFDKRDFFDRLFTSANI